MPRPRRRPPRRLYRARQPNLASRIMGILFGLLLAVVIAGIGYYAAYRFMSGALERMTTP